MMNSRFKYMAAMLAALMLLSACAGAPDAGALPTPSPETTQSTAPGQAQSSAPAVSPSAELSLPGVFSREELAAVVSEAFGQTDFWSVDTQQRLSLDELAQTFTSDSDLYVAVKRYALLDLDGDGEDEMVLWLAAVSNEYFGFVILRRAGDELYAYSRYYRGLMDLKADGTFTASSGVADWGYCTISFTEDGSTDTFFTYCQSTEAGEEYFVEGAAASEEEFDAAVARQSAKEDAPWVDLD